MEKEYKALWVKPDTFRKVKIELAKKGLKTDEFIKLLLEHEKRTNKAQRKDNEVS